jgi:anti-anti-sigma factor
MSETTTVEGVTIYRVTTPRLFKDDDLQVLRDETTALVQPLDAPKLAIDLRQVQFVSSRGLGVLVALRKTIKDRGGALALFGVNETIAKVLSTTRMDTLFPVEKSETDAVQALNGQQLLTFLK